MFKKILEHFLIGAVYTFWVGVATWVYLKLAMQATENFIK